MTLTRLAVRALVGGLFIGHGTQKLKGWFGGPGLTGTTAMMESLGLNPPRRNALAAGTSETTAGVLLLTGLATPLAAATLTGTMLTAIRTVHLKNGPWVSSGGYEYHAVLIALVLALADEGPGDLSLDRVLGIERTGLGWALGALALGTAASVATVELGRRTPAPPAAVPENVDASDDSEDVVDGPATS